jgi:serralysin
MPLFFNEFITADSNNNLNLPNPFIPPIVGTIPAAPPTPISLYTVPNPALSGLNLYNYFFAIVQGAAVVPTAQAFFDYTNNADNEIVPNWSGFGPTFSGGIRALNGDDVINASVENDVVNGNQGADTLIGQAGYDYLRGGRGNDLVIGLLDSDIVNGNRDNDFVVGDNGSDLVRGGQGDDTLSGGNGSDVLIGDIGSDNLSGNAGADAFVLRSDGANLAVNEFAADFVADFNLAQQDYIIVNGLNRNQLTFDATVDVNSDGFIDVIIRAPGGIIGVVSGSNGAGANDVFNNLFTVAIDSPLITGIG